MMRTVYTLTDCEKYEGNRLWGVYTSFQKVLDDATERSDEMLNWVEINPTLWKAELSRHNSLEIEKIPLDQIIF